MITKLRMINRFRSRIIDKNLYNLFIIDNCYQYANYIARLNSLINFKSSDNNIILQLVFFCGSRRVPFHREI